MHNEVATLIGGWWRHPLYGINALAAELPRGGWNGADDDTAPPTVVIATDLESPEMMETLDPPAYPALGLWMGESTPVMYSGRKAAQVDAMAAYMTPFKIDQTVAIRESGYILRAGLWNMELYESQGLSEPQGGPSYRQHNGIRVMKVVSVKEARRTATSKGRKTKMWGFLDITVVVIDGVLNLPAPQPA